MPAARRPPSSLAIVLVGLAALASAMGVGRFAFTPLLPLMQAHDGLSLGQGAWLAGANYLGYAVGALACSIASPPPDAAARHGLVAVALSTLAMGATASYEAWLVLRFVAGVASACVLVGVSAWAIATLAERGRGAWSGGVFSGVGIGIALAGAAGLVAGLAGDPPARVWIVLGVLSSAVAALAWLPLRADKAQVAASAAATDRSSLREWRLIAGYGAFGFGYIIPATFLPAMAREAIADPAVFGWVWPAFGIAAAASTALVALAFRGASPRRLWTASLLVMAVGVIAPVLRPGVASLLVAAVSVGGTFMVATLAGMQEARRRAGPAAPRLMAAMTFAFALGQLAGPAVVALASPGSGGSAGPSVLGALCLLAAAFALGGPGALVSPATLREQGQRP
ncbi:MAG: YbfB/YjiJ family MFS transporter [Burkholderiales bacterium]|nr:YbfB/YjiJ family MFS transporter [Burkholderiales bacterium]